MSGATITAGLPFAHAVQVGEAFAGKGAETAHLNTVLGRRGGPFETAWVTALAFLGRAADPD